MVAKKRVPCLAVCRFMTETTMSEMPIRLMPAHDEMTLRAIIERVQTYDLHIVEARALIMPAFDVELDERAERLLTDYLDAILDRVHSCELDVETAASDIWEMAYASQLGDPDLELLKQIGSE